MTFPSYPPDHQPAEEDPIVLLDDLDVPHNLTVSVARNGRAPVFYRQHSQPSCCSTAFVPPCLIAKGVGDLVKLVITTEDAKRGGRQAKRKSRCQAKREQLERVRKLLPPKMVQAKARIWYHLGWWRGPPSLKGGATLRFHCLDLYHKLPDSRERQYKSRTPKRRFGPALRAGENLKCKYK